MKETLGLYIADTMDSIAIAFLIPLVCYGVTGGYAAFESLRLFLGKEVVFRKPTRPSLPLRKAPPFSPSLSSLRDERM